LPFPLNGNEVGKCLKIGAISQLLYVYATKKMRALGDRRHKFGVYFE
jgi:hypothetical protein